MKAPFLARKTHKWIALILGVQVAFWMLSGAYMALLDIDFIHGDPLVRNTDESITGNLANLYPIQAVIERYPRTTGVDLVSRMAAPHYVVNTESEPSALLDANSGDVVSPVNLDTATALAKYYYAGAGEVAEVRLLTEEADKPSEIQSRPLPLWQVRFNDAIDTTFYVSPSTGALVTRRHAFWRLYDFLWMFHIMDYENRSDINNNLLRAASMLGIAFAFSGIWLLVYALKRRQLPVKPGTVDELPRRRAS